MVWSGLETWLGINLVPLSETGIVLGGLAGLGLAGYAVAMSRRARLHAAEYIRERIMREELEAYSKLDATLSHDSDERPEPVQARKALATRVCRTIADKSAFTRVMMLMRDAEGNLPCIASTGVDDLTVSALARWGEQVVAEERGQDTAATRRDDPDAPRRSGVRTAGKPVGNQSGMTRTGALQGRGGASFSIQLGGWEEFDREVGTWEMAGKSERRRWRRAIVLPIRTRAASAVRQGSLAGAIVVCADGLASITDRKGGGKERLDRLLGPLEMLAARLGRAAENEALSERLLQVEKSAGIGKLAGGVAHALNNPLTAVLGYAELITETTHDPRTLNDARTVVAEAQKMRAILDRLNSLSQPALESRQSGEAVNLLDLLHEAEQRSACGLAARGIRLEIATHGIVSPLRGDATRLAEVIDQLIRNAADAIGKARPREEGESHSIRISVSGDEETLHLTVSDTGTGFEQPGRAFDPFYTTSDHPSEGSGLGLSICFSIVREHAGRISAFNLHPHGAAVVVELPLHPGAQLQTAKPAKRGVPALQAN